MSLRLFVDTPLQAGAELDLPPGAARHVQVRRLQPGDALLLFDGRGGEWTAGVTAMGRSSVTVRLGDKFDTSRELPVDVTLAVGMPANERMDWLIEKATELGVARVRPLVCERSVLRLSGERADRKRDHWQGVAVSAAEQSGRTRVPVIEPVVSLQAFVALADDGALRWLLSPRAQTGPSALGLAGAARGVLMLSGPEGGLSPAEEAAALAAGFIAVGLGPRVLRADTAPLALLAWLSLSS